MNVVYGIFCAVVSQSHKSRFVCKLR